MRCLDPHGGLFAFAAGLPEPNVVDQLIAAALYFLLPFPGAPDFDPMINEPFHQERRLVFTSAKTVKHENQQNIKFLFFGQGSNIEDRVTIFSGNLVAGYAFFHPLVVECPVIHSGNEIHAFTTLHGDIICDPVNLPFG